jgi:catechol 2,3-dioxygenase-like lactoylglutathione lyase family enzyme
MDMKLLVIGIPVSDVETAKSFYTRQVGFDLDHDITPGEGMRVVQMTPPGSPCSVVIGDGLPLGEPGSTRGPQLVVQDLDAVRAELLSRDVQVSDVQQLGPEGAPGSRFAFFSDPTGTAGPCRSTGPDVRSFSVRGQVPAGASSVSRGAVWSPITPEWPSSRAPTAQAARLASAAASTAAA